MQCEITANSLVCHETHIFSIFGVPTETLSSVYLQGVTTLENAGRSAVAFVSVEESRRVALNKIVHHRCKVVTIIVTAALCRYTDTQRATCAGEDVESRTRFAFHPLRRTACFVLDRDKGH